MDDLRHDLPDEVVDVDMAKIMIFFSKDAWVEIQRRGSQAKLSSHVHLATYNLHHFKL